MEIGSGSGRRNRAQLKNKDPREANPNQSNPIFNPKHRLLLRPLIVFKSLFLLSFCWWSRRRRIIGAFVPQSPATSHEWLRNLWPASELFLPEQILITF